MRRVPGLVDISRREFCALAGGMGLLLAGCVDGDTSVVQTGPLGSSESPDAGRGSGTPDGSTMPPGDAGSMAMCTGSPTDVGLPSTFMMNTPVYFSTAKFFVVRDAGGLYAVTAKCTHEGIACTVSSARFRCPKHGALFTFDGAIISGPVTKPLVHYAMCLMTNGHVGVTPNALVPATTRLVA